jgi:cytochrome c oxidase subunit 2
MSGRGRIGGLVLAAAALALLPSAVAADAAAPQPPAKQAKQAARPTKKFRLDAEKWAWTPDTITVKRGTHVVLDVTSGDASRALELKEYGVKATVPQGEVVRVEFDADRAGTFPFRCSRPCGDGCAKLRGKLVVEE